MLDKQSEAREEQVKSRKSSTVFLTKTTHSNSEQKPSASSVYAPNTQLSIQRF